MCRIFSVCPTEEWFYSLFPDLFWMARIRVRPDFLKGFEEWTELLLNARVSEVLVLPMVRRIRQNILVYMKPLRRWSHHCICTSAPVSTSLWEVWVQHKNVSSFARTVLFSARVIHKRFIELWYRKWHSDRSRALNSISMSNVWLRDRNIEFKKYKYSLH